MGADQALDLMGRALWTSALVSAPVLLAVLVVGVIISVLQVATQLQEATLSYVPKLIASGVVLMLAGAWMMHALSGFAISVINLIRTLG
jgi:flagellar biosynthetic protein FliQ